ncbi:hypothetical protein [Mucilaginibacter polytrichastri]|uniref:Lipoprotein n=1 Tax=Mucilaginibacter polytrichastri TaxID=1302689 RepID=A0A1Q6A099_9SPHI|nr:hypothetical protein [Mucilaginibacter polytrichastri]OKS87440.1 hypothetical protein RG47T_2901 [Mucilaginibacter polytrichastri]SFS90671.1 hypothetical protein SAMN04487890_10636 [Mucilaginibacter polytrichastri]
MTNILKSLSGKFYVALFLVISVFFQSCSEPAEKFFDVALLNTNTIVDFGTPILAKHINDEATEYPNIPSSKKKGNEALTNVQNNVLYMEKALKDVKALSANDEKRKVIKAQSIALYEYVIPVYKKEYTAYAKLCDAKAPQAQKDELINLIRQKYNAGFEKQYAALVSNGKAFAKDNNIDVHWN